MFNLLVKGGGWNERADWLPDERVFEYTAPSLADRFRRRGESPADAVRNLPTLFMPEIGGADEDARIGHIVGFRVGQKRVGLDYVIENHRIPLEEIQRLASELDINRFEFNRTHWAIKDVNLLGVLESIASTSETSELVRATTPEQWRKRALNIVEEVAAECAQSDDPEERAAGLLALAAAEGLRPYVVSGIENPDRRSEWVNVVNALVAFIPHGQKVWNFVNAVRELARAYDLPLS